MITKDMNLLGVLKMYPAAVEVLQESGMGCIGCLASKFETIEQGAQAHGIDIDLLMYKLNEAITASKNA